MWKYQLKKLKLTKFKHNNRKKQVVWISENQLPSPWTFTNQEFKRHYFQINLTSGDSNINQTNINCIWSKNQEVPIGSEQVVVWTTLIRDAKVDNFGFKVSNNVVSYWWLHSNCLCISPNITKSALFFSSNLLFSGHVVTCWVFNTQISWTRHDSEIGTSREGIVEL